MFLREVQLWNWPSHTDTYPFNLPAFQGLSRISFRTAVTFFVGENGSGKSTLLEAIAKEAGFNPEGGNRNHIFSTADSESSLHHYIRLSWMPKVTSGFFLRAESFFNFSSYIDTLAKDDMSDNVYAAYGGKSLHQQSHGESFLSLFTHHFQGRRRALYLLDEPEAALSPARQLALLRILWDHEQAGQSQFIIATHSPILLGYPHATILSFDQAPLAPIRYEDTDHFIITKQFLTHRDRILRELFKENQD
ncbi:AAA family ATPase [Sulfobacillus thermosulfidooxidans]|uniref:AAA family ATPase n=1 Tax=Sulfobacillus thermosulfidooxidans TaxID=28034 RepID=UPI0006B4FB1F|nr:AAA family ATPase [Sulfobacillus thermosulfidooxidans]